MFNLFLFAIFLAALGPINLGLPILVNTSWGVMRMLVLFLLFLSFYQSFREKKFKILESKIILPILTYLLVAILSMLLAQNLENAWEDLEVFITAILFFYLSFYYLSSKKEVWQFVYIIFGTAVLVSLASFLAFLLPSVYEILGRRFIPVDVFRKYLFDRARGRILPLWDIEMIIPFALFLAFQGKNIYKAMGGVGAAILSLAVFLSNVRYRFLVFIFGFFSYLGLTRQFRKGLILLGLLVVVFGLYLIFAGPSLGVNIIERFLLQDPLHDIHSLEIRFKMWEEAWEMFLSSPLLGVGIGNYVNKLSLKFRYHGVAFDPFYVLVIEAYSGPHNWPLLALAEMGILGLVALAWIFFSFLRQDIFLYQRIKKESEKALVLGLICSSWSFVLASLTTNITTSLAAMIFFWSLRGVITAIVEKKII